jgi:hypothetical protein
MYPRAQTTIVWAHVACTMDHLQPLVALAAMGVGMYMVVAGELWVRGGGIIVNGGGHCRGLGIRAEFGRRREMESKNESKNDTR